MSDAIVRVRIDRVVVRAGAADGRRLRRALRTELAPALAARLGSEAPLHRRGGRPSAEGRVHAAADEIATRVRQEIEDR